MLYYIISNVMTSSIPTKKISSPKNTNIYDVIFVLTSKKFQNKKNVNCQSWYGIPSTMFQLIRLTWCNIKVYYHK